MPDRSDSTRSAPASPIPQVDSGEHQASGIWQVRDGGLARYGDWWSIEALQEALDGPEHPEGRIPRADVETLLRLIEVGIACLPGVIHAAAYRECVECGSEWFEGDEHAPETHRSACSFGGHFGRSGA